MIRRVSPSSSVGLLISEGNAEKSDALWGDSGFIVSAGNSGILAEVDTALNSGPGWVEIISPPEGDEELFAAVFRCLDAERFVVVSGLCDESVKRGLAGSVARAGHLVLAELPSSVGTALDFFGVVPSLAPASEQESDPANAGRVEADDRDAVDSHEVDDDDLMDYMPDDDEIEPVPPRRSAAAVMVAVVALVSVASTVSYLGLIGSRDLLHGVPDISLQEKSDIMEGFVEPLPKIVMDSVWVDEEGVSVDGKVELFGSGDKTLKVSLLSDGGRVALYKEQQLKADSGHAAFSMQFEDVHVGSRILVEVKEGDMVLVTSENILPTPEIAQ